ncbi:bacillithiol system redox-active protein YtxJ [Bacteroidota bacterium]
MSWKNFFGSGSSNIPWKELTSETQLSEAVKASFEKPQLIFKHSTRCSISSMAKSRLERDWNLEQVEPWYLDLIAYRNISNMIASQLGIHHESPQAIVLKDGVVVHDSSHNSIAVSEIAKHVS